MKDKRRFIFQILIILSIAALVMKKFMIPFHSFFLIVIFDCMALFFFLQEFRPEKIRGVIRGISFNFDLSSLIYGFCSIAILYRLEYWDGWERWISVTGVLLLVVSVFALYSLLSASRSPDWKKSVRTFLHRHLPWLYFVIIFTPVALCNPRTFHNMFNGSTYESFVRKRYSAEEGTALIELYKPTGQKSKKCAEEYLIDALEAEKHEEYHKALEYYNRSIDRNPSHAESIYRRGKLKLTRLEINSDMAESALGDFSRAIQLDSNMAAAYYHRAVAHSYLFPKKRLPSMNDLLKAQSLDSSLKTDEYLKEFLTSPLNDSAIQASTNDLDSKKE